MIKSEFDLSISDEKWVEFNALRMAFVKAERQYRRDQLESSCEKADALYKALRVFMRANDLVLWPFLVESDNLFVIEGGLSSLGG